MLNFENCVYSSIGARVKQFKDNNGMSYSQLKDKLMLADFSKYEEYANRNYINHACSFSKATLIHLLRGESRGKAFFPKNSILFLCSLMKLTPQELLFGNPNEREDLVMHMLLAIIVNGDFYQEAEKHDDIYFAVGSEVIINPILSVKNDVSKTDRDYFIRFCRNMIQDDDISNGLLTALEYTRKELPRDVNDNIDVPVSSSSGAPARDDLVIIQKIPSSIFEMQLNKYVQLADEHLYREYGFFADPRQYAIAEQLKGKTEFILQQSSNLLIKTLLGNLEFATDFLQSRMRYEQNLDENGLYFEDFTRNEGCYGGFAMEWKGIPGTHINRYRLFVKAFDEMWNRNKNRFMEFFNKRIFDYPEETKLVKKSIGSKDKSEKYEFRPDGEPTYEYKCIEARFKELTDEKLQSLLISDEFGKLLYEILEREQYEKETMHGHMYAHTVLHGLIANTADGVDFTDDYNIDRLNNDISVLMTSYLKLQKQEEPDASLSLGRYCDIKPFI